MLMKKQKHWSKNSMHKVHNISGSRTHCSRPVFFCLISGLTGFIYGTCNLAAHHETCTHGTYTHSQGNIELPVTH